MRVTIDDEAAVERVRRKRGDKSATETIAGLVAEADKGGDPVAAYATSAKVEDRGRAAEQRRRMRKGAK